MTYLFRLSVVKFLNKYFDHDLCLTKIKINEKLNKSDSIARMEEWLLLPQIEQFTLSIYPRSNKGISNRQKSDFIDNL